MPISCIRHHFSTYSGFRAIFSLGRKAKKGKEKEKEKSGNGWKVPLVSQMSISDDNILFFLFCSSMRERNRWLFWRRPPKLMETEGRTMIAPRHKMGTSTLFLSGFFLIK
jgi:hypothetical protein